jgi:hypothetical protein
MADWLDNLHPALRPLFDLENELRRAAQNAIFMRNDEAKKHLEEARRHYGSALQALKGEVPSGDPTSKPDEVPPPRTPPAA